MSLIKRRVSERKVAANQANARKSTGPKTAEGKARVALNGLKGGAYAKADSVLRLMMHRKGEEPKEFEQVHQDLVDSWHPDDSMQAMVVKTITDKTWEKLELRRDALESRLTAFQCEQIEGQRQKLLARRWQPGSVPGPGERPGLWLAEDSPQKFRETYQALDHIQEWAENDDCPSEYPETMDLLYGDLRTRAGQRIRELFIEMVSEDEPPAVRRKAQRELPKWIAQERRDVQREQELYQRELVLRTRRPHLSEKELVAREAALDRQIAEQARLLLQLKSKRFLWAPQPEAGEAAVGQAVAAGTGPVTGPATAPVTGEQARPAGGEGEEFVASGAVIAKRRQNGEAKPIGTVESTT